MRCMHTLLLLMFFGLVSAQDVYFTNPTGTSRWLCDGSTYTVTWYANPSVWSGYNFNVYLYEQSDFWPDSYTFLWTVSATSGSHTFTPTYGMCSTESTNFYFELYYSTVYYYDSLTFKLIDPNNPYSTEDPTITSPTSATTWPVSGLKTVSWTVINQWSGYSFEVFLYKEYSLWPDYWWYLGKASSDSGQLTNINLDALPADFYDHIDGSGLKEWYIALYYWDGMLPYYPAQSDTFIVQDQFPALTSICTSMASYDVLGIICCEEGATETDDCRFPIAFYEVGVDDLSMSVNYCETTPTLIYSMNIWYLYQDTFGTGWTVYPYYDILSGSINLAEGYDVYTLGVPGLPSNLNIGVTFTVTLSTGSVEIAVSLTATVIGYDALDVPLTSLPVITLPGCGSGECAPGCSLALIGNGECDSVCDVPACNNDDGDCSTGSDCAVGCPSASLGNGQCDTACNVAACNYDNGDCSSADCASGCPDSWVGDGFCDSTCNVAACDYDGGDCQTGSPSGTLAVSCAMTAAAVGVAMLAL